MFGIAPFTAFIWFDSIDPCNGSKRKEAHVKSFSCGRLAHEWIEAALPAEPNATGEVEIFDARGVCCFSDLICG